MQVEAIWQLEQSRLKLKSSAHLSNERWPFEPISRLFFKGQSRPNCSDLLFRCSIHAYSDLDLSDIASSPQVVAIASRDNKVEPP
jgi:hypothetical protein